MKNIVKSVVILVFMTLLQLAIYELALKPTIATWGATQAEVSMPMAGDDNALTISSTRAIQIDAEKSEVWKWLMQLGADRGGFYSYYFIEKAMGYKTRHQDNITAEFPELVVGDLIRGSIDQDSSIIAYNFPVLQVKTAQELVLDQWGSFALTQVTSGETRLIIRTQSAPINNKWLQTAHYIGVPLHYIMERRTLLGIKARVEAGENILLSTMADKLWFTGIVFSAVFIWLLVFIGRGIQSIVIPTILSLLWLFSLLLFTPLPLYSLGLLSAVLICIIRAMKVASYRRRILLPISSII
ncbi:MAG: hypothetical protein OFPI_24850 [Osedax symbiont Rs2]|nr:MAG: hypothetical protein OFPI_24850 [Osedax symbiont Rs2]